MQNKTKRNEDKQKLRVDEQFHCSLPKAKEGSDCRGLPVFYVHQVWKGFSQGSHWMMQEETRWIKTFKGYIWASISTMRVLSRQINISNYSVFIQTHSPDLRQNN